MASESTRLTPRALLKIRGAQHPKVAMEHLSSLLIQEATRHAEMEAIDMLPDVKAAEEREEEKFLKFKSKKENWKVLKQLNVFSSDDVDSVAEALNDMLIKKLYMVVEMAAQWEDGGAADAIYSGKQKKSKFQWEKSGDLATRVSYNILDYVS
ncbi:unnamed protein product [Fraxinus pennsylvanica]|uniref:Uncharacterized protein n=1 Tax=Fraxinus pennsylvanica TaxID=56036 RepID=A0AAD2EEP5_9LAMI|nr:unnamed protein product [Fraxinus pennsylvanica]